MKILYVFAFHLTVCLPFSVTQAEMRIWTLADGEYFSAELLTFSGPGDRDAVRLRTDRGEQEFQLVEFSAEDRQFVQDTIKQFQYSHGRSLGTASGFSKRNHYKPIEQRSSFSPKFEYIDHDGRVSAMPIPADSTAAEISSEQLEQSQKISPAQDSRMYNEVRSGGHSVSKTQWRRLTNIQKNQLYRQHEVWKLANDRQNKLLRAQRRGVVPANARQMAEEEDDRLRQQRDHVEKQERAARIADAAWNQADIDRHRMNNAADEAARAKWQAENTSMAQDQFDMHARQAEISRQEAERKWRESENRRQQAESDLHRQRMNSSW